MTRRLAEVARKVGVSEATVSRVLNGKPGVSEATRQAVLTALDVLGYERPTKLRGERARLVGLVLPELQNPIFPAFAEVMGVALAQRGFTPVLCTQTAGGITEADYVDLLLQQQVSGIVFAGGLYAQRDAAHGHYARLRERGVPTVLVNAAIDGLGFPTRLLRRRGRHRAGDRAPAVPRPHADRRARRARPTTCRRTASSRPPGAFATRTASPLPETHVAAAPGTRSRPPRRRPCGCCDAGVTGIVCASDPMALGAIRAARRAGLDVPRDVSIVGLRRLGPDELHRAAADHRPPADRADGRGW